MNKYSRILVFLCFCLEFGTLAAAPQWVAHASAPGPDLPPVGRSRFDQLFADGENGYRIPYPFDALVALLESKIDNGGASGVRQVFIPLGRSLQRNAPAPDYFRYPRSVIALQGEPLMSADVLQYRLFIAHQPGSESLEVISYNDSAGRFEFQVVENYAADGQPAVRQANRQMCLSCHQNAAPIFPTQPWSETTFNAAVASRLVAALPQRFHSLVGTLTDDAGAIDLLSERANYLAAAQLIWRRGCGDARCRAAALRAALQFRLSGDSGFAREDPSYLQDYRAELERNWARNWPDGLALANSRIVDRDPFAAPPPARVEDALARRPAHAVWHGADAIFADGIIYRLGGFFTRADIQRLDAYLVALGARRAVAEQVFGADCRLANVGAANRLLECSDAGDRHGLHATLEIDYEGGKTRSLQVLSLRMPGEAGLLQADVGELSRRADGLGAELVDRQAGLSMRLANGDRLRSLELHWRDESLRGPSRIEISLAQEFQIVDEAIALLLREHRGTGAGSLGDKPFRRAAIVAELDAALAMLNASGPEAGESAAMPPPGLPAAPPEADASRLRGDLALLQPMCGRCHAAETRNPPGFLAGDDSPRRIRQCAPRILARLRAWHDSDDFAIVPMPPPATIEESWARGNYYRKLVGAVAGLLQQEPAAAAAATGSAAYERLPPCLASGQSG
jgi:hypothetical protein